MTSAPEFSRVPHTPHSHDVQALESLAEALAAVDFAHDAIHALLGDGPFDALMREHLVPARYRIQTILEGGVRVGSGGRRMAGAVDFFLLGAALSPEALDAVLGEGAHELLDRLGFLAPADTEAEVPDPAPDRDAGSAGPGTTVPSALPGRAGGRVRAAFDLRPHAADDGTELWVASDLGAHQTPGALHRDHVLGIGQASLTLAQLTERREVQRALDLGTGCGIQTFHLLAHARQVVATDLSERALAFTRFNLVLNAAALGLDPQHLEERVVLRRGSLLEPVAGEAFDLVVSNPPFVITPRRQDESAADRYTYRDGGLPGDQLVAALVAGVPEVLAPGGRAQLLGNWEIPAGSEGVPDGGDAPAWEVRPRAWVPQEVEAWFIQREELSPEQYAETWLRDASQHRDPEAFDQGYRDYLRDFAERGVGAVGFGMIWLRRPGHGERPERRTGPGSQAPAAAPARLLRFEEITHPLQQPIAPFLSAAVSAHDGLAALDDAALRARHLEVAEDVTEERHQRPGAEHPGVILLRQGAGFRRTELLSTEAAGFVSACDGELSVGQILDALAALLDWQGPAPGQALLGAVRSLIEGGFLLLR